MQLVDKTVFIASFSIDGIVQSICIFYMFMSYEIIIMKYYVRICKVMSYRQMSSLNGNSKMKEGHHAWSI